IVLSYTGMFKDPTPGGTKPGCEEAFVSAEAWVRYANIINAYGIKYWMIGNESYNTNEHSYNGFATKEQYRDDVKELSQRLKTIDPSIKIIANGNTNDWWETVLGGASAHIDYLGISNFPVWEFKEGYNYYRNNTPELKQSIDRAINSIYAFAPEADKARLKLIVTEVNCMDWEGSWENNNDLGHCLVTFEILGEQLNEEHIKASLFWSTRWLKFDRMTEISSAINDSGHISPNGKAIEIWGNFIGNKMVALNSTSIIRTFASCDSEQNKLFVYIINKDFHAKPVKLNLENFPAKKAILRQFSGSGPLDRNPVLSLKYDIEAIENNFLVLLPAVSLTILEISQEENSIAKKTAYSHLIIYPNPSKGIITVGLTPY
nr:hypothetical protein [Bacteroidota bacterium]